MIRHVTDTNHMFGKGENSLCEAPTGGLTGNWGYVNCEKCLSLRMPKTDIKFEDMYAVSGMCAHFSKRIQFYASRADSKNRELLIQLKLEIDAALDKYQALWDEVNVPKRKT